MRHAWPIIEPVQAYVDNWHIRIACQDLEKLWRGKIPDNSIIINIPPGCMKSILIVMFRAWLWIRDPAYRFLSASYSDHLTIRDNLKLRDIVQNLWYQAHFPDVALVDDQNVKKLFKTTRGGQSFATSVGGGGTGEHPDFIFIDDPITALQALSKAERDNASNWLKNTISSRGLSRGVKKVLVMQRLHEEDPTGMLLGTGGWQHLCLPMRFEVGRKDTDPRDPRTRDGELLWPKVFDEVKVQKLEKALGPYDAAGQLQQRPAPAGGGMFKREWFKVITAIPQEFQRSVRRTRFWDCAASEGKGDYTVGARVAVAYDGPVFIEHIVREQWSPGVVDGMVKSTALSDGYSVAVREEEEGGSSGKAVTHSRSQKLHGFDYRGIRSTGSKPVRWKPLATQAENGNVYLIAGEWNAAFLDEIMMVPNAAHDDQADAVAGAYNDLTQTGSVQQRRLAGY